MQLKECCSRVYQCRGERIRVLDNPFLRSFDRIRVSQNKRTNATRQHEDSSYAVHVLRGANSVKISTKAIRHTTMRLSLRVEDSQ